MKYTTKVKCSLTNAPNFVWEQLRKDFQFVENECAQGVSWKDAQMKMIARMWLGDIGEWMFTGGSTIVRVDKDKHFLGSEENWKERMQKTYEHTLQKTNRVMFGRRFFKKIPTPTSFVFFERSENSGGRHFHSIHHFPSATVNVMDDYLDMFRSLWNQHEVNRTAGRRFWYERVECQDKITRYVTKKITDDYENGWFATT